MSTTSPSTEIYERLADIELHDAQGQPLRLGDRLEDQLSILVFIRHFG